MHALTKFFFAVIDFVSEFVSDRVNLANIFAGFFAYWLHAIATTRVWIEAATPFITFISMVCLCGYNIIKFYRTLKNKPENES